MNFDFDTSVYDILENSSGVSGSSIVCSSDYNIIEVRSIEDIKDNFTPVSTVSFCMMFVLLLFFWRLLDVFKAIICRIINGGN